LRQAIFTPMLHTSSCNRQLSYKAASAEMKWRGRGGGPGTVETRGVAAYTQ